MRNGKKKKRKYMKSGKCCSLKKKAERKQIKGINKITTRKKKVNEVWSNFAH